MQIYKLNSSFTDQLVIDISERLSNGDVGIIPTETVFGLMCVYDNDEGQQKIFTIKNRGKEKKLQILVASIAQIKWINLELDANLQQLAKHFWPGPLMLIIKNKLNEEIGVRIPNHHFVQSLINRIGKPLLATSANLSGNEPQESYDQEFKDLIYEPDFAVTCKLNAHQPSTIIRFHENRLELIREGAIKFDSILKKAPELSSSAKTIIT